MKKNIIEEMCSWVLLINNYWMRFYNIQNDEGRDRGYQPHPSASADNPYKDLDCSGYHKNRIL